MIIDDWTNHLFIIVCRGFRSRKTLPSANPVGRLNENRRAKHLFHHEKASLSFFPLLEWSKLSRSDVTHAKTATLDHTCTCQSFLRGCWLVRSIWKGFNKSYKSQNSLSVPSEWPKCSRCSDPIPFVFKDWFSLGHWEYLVQLIHWWSLSIKTVRRIFVVRLFLELTVLPWGVEMDEIVLILIPVSTPLYSLITERFLYWFLMNFMCGIKVSLHMCFSKSLWIFTLSDGHAARLGLKKKWKYLNPCCVEGCSAYSWSSDISL